MRTATPQPPRPRFPIAGLKICLLVSLIALLAWGTALPGAIAQPIPSALGLRVNASESPASPVTFLASGPPTETLSQLRKAAFAASQAGRFDEAEKQWSALIDRLPTEAALWSNRGNVRVQQNNLEGAMADYNQAIALAPDAPDPYLNRGTLWEAMGQWETAIADYNQVLQLDPDDPAAYNNRGNAEAAQGEWELAVADFQAAITLQPSYSAAYGNYALALYQVGETDRSLQIMKSLVRKYPRFADMRAALTAVLWDQGLSGEAESNWVAVVGLDSRYKDIHWVKDVRRWPPKVVAALERFLSL